MDAPCMSSTSVRYREFDIALENVRDPSYFQILEVIDSQDVLDVPAVLPDPPVASAGLGDNAVGGATGGDPVDGSLEGGPSTGLSPELSISTREARALGIVLAPVRAQDPDEEDEDYGNPFDAEDEDYGNPFNVEDEDYGNPFIEDQDKEALDLLDEQEPDKEFESTVLALDVHVQQRPSDDYRTHTRTQLDDQEELHTVQDVRGLSQQISAEDEDDDLNQLDSEIGGQFLRPQESEGSQPQGAEELERQEVGHEAVVRNPTSNNIMVEQALEDHEDHVRNMLQQQVARAPGGAYTLNSALKVKLLMETTNTDGATSGQVVDTRVVSIMDPIIHQADQEDSTALQEFLVVKKDSSESSAECSPSSASSV